MHCFGISSNINLYNEFAKSQLICEWLHVKVFHLRSFPANMRLDEDIFRLGQNQYICLGHTPSRRLQDVFKASSRRFQDILKTSSQDVFKMSSKRLEDVLKKRIHDINMCDIVFEKAKGRGGRVNRTSVYTEAAVRRVL